MDTKKIGVVAAGLMIVIGAAWLFGFFGGTDPAIAELQQFRDENFQKMDQMTDEERRTQWGAFRERVDSLSDDQRREFFEGSREFFQARMLERMNRFFDLPADEQEQELDAQIDRMEQRRRERAAGGDSGRGDRGGPGGGGPGGRGGGGGGKNRLDRSTPEMRAKFDRYRDMLNDRREERGMEPADGGRPFGGGFR